MSNIYLLKLHFEDNDFAIIIDIRKNVFANELGIPESNLFDKYDETCDHFILFDEKNPIGTIRFVRVGKNVKLERMAILSEFRAKSYGKNAILQLKEYYQTQGYSKIILDSIYHVRNFYKKCGFLEEGKIFQRVGIDHIRMSLVI
jgi:predicted GNAT family N-acyltransferase|tara:strand:- start:469 stop:903 length:435 start_codon:yes stop_codon:yes gene_type:complete